MYFNFPLLLRKKMQVISLAPPCPSKRTSASTFSTNDFICITHLSDLYLFINSVFNLFYVFYISNCVYLRRLNQSNIL